MKRNIIFLWAFAAVLTLLAGCAKESITDNSDGTDTVTVSCSDINEDISVLRSLVVEKASGSTVVSLSDNTITFSSGTTLTLTLRKSYGFSYVNPTVGVVDGNYVIDGQDIGVGFADTALQLRVSGSSWQYYSSGNWITVASLVQGSSIPIFSSVTQRGQNVIVSLGSKDTLELPIYQGSDSITLDKTAASVGIEGGSVSVSVTSSKSWGASSDASWLTVSPAAGQSGTTAVTLKASANESYGRSATVTFSIGSLKAKIVVSQDGESGGGTIGGDDTEQSEDNIANTNFDRTIKITFVNGGTATVSGDANGVVSVSGNDVTVDNRSTTEKVIYELSGTTTNGFLKIYSNNKQALLLKGVSITNPNGAAINNQGKKRLFVQVTGNNTLADGTSYTQTPSDEQEKAAFFSEGQIIFSGDGTLTVTAKGKSGITSDDYVRFMSSPTVKVTSTAGHGVRGQDAIIVSAGNIEANVSAAMKKGFSTDSLARFDGGTTVIKVTGGSGKDDDGSYSSSAGIKADQLFEMTGGSLTINNSGAGGKGIRVGSAYDASNVVHLAQPSYISGGSCIITTTGAKYTTGDKNPKGFKAGWAYKASDRDHTYKDFTGDFEMRGGILRCTVSNAEGIEIKRTLTVSGGEIAATSSSDDAINSASTFTINDGFVFGASTANDGLDANGNFEINGGVVVAYGKTTPEMAIDANSEGSFKLTVKGGTIFAIGSLESGSTLTQSCYQASSWSKNTWYSLTVGSDTYCFKTPSSGGSKLVVSGASQPSVKSNVTLSGGTEIFMGYGAIGASVSGGSSVSLSNYSSSGGGRP